MEISLHDNWIYAHQVDHDGRMIILHTVYPHGEPNEFTDVIFEDVLVHHFETQCMTTNPPYPSNVLFDIEEEDAKISVERYFDAISKQKNYGWPVASWSSIDDLVKALTSKGHRSFHIHGTVGLDGFVFARRLILKPRLARWNIQPELVDGAAPDSASV